MKHDPLFEKLRSGPEDQALEIFDELMFRSDQYERLRRHAVPREEVDVWKKLHWEKYQHLSKRKAAKMIKGELLSSWSDGTIRRHL